MAEVNECKVYVGNLPFSVGFQELKDLFSSYGEIAEATVIVNRYTGRSKGFGFVTFSTKDAADKAIAEMDAKEIKGRKIIVKAAKPVEEKENKDASKETPEAQEQEAAPETQGEEQKAQETPAE